MSAGDEARSRISQRAGAEDFRKVFALATASAITLIAVVVISRRLSGAFVVSVPPVVPCFVATIAALLSLAGLALWTTASAAATTTRRQFLASAVAVVPSIALGLALWSAPSVFVGSYLAALSMAAVMGAVALQDAATGFALTNRLQSIAKQSPALVVDEPPSEQAKNEPLTVDTASDPPAADVGGSSTTAEQRESDIEHDDEDEEASDPSITQWMSRRQLADGCEVIEGAVRILLTQADKVGVAHLAFVPPLAGDPQAECHLLSDFDGRVRITTAKSYGLRIEARQSAEPAIPIAITVAFTAQTSAAASADGSTVVSPPASTAAAA